MDILVQNILPYYNQDIVAKNSLSVLKDFIQQKQDIKQLLFIRNKLISKYAHSPVVANTTAIFLFSLSKQY